MNNKENNNFKRCMQSLCKNMKQHKAMTFYLKENPSPVGSKIQG